MITLKNITGTLLVMVLSTGALMAQDRNPVTPKQTQTPQATKYSDTELRSFLSAYQKMQAMSQNMQLKVAEMVQEEGMDVQRFNEIHQAKMTPGQEANATAEETKKHQEILAKVEQMQQAFEKEVVELLKHEKISMEKYQEIVTALQTDPELQARAQQLMQG